MAGVCVLKSSSIWGNYSGHQMERSAEVENFLLHSQFIPEGVADFGAAKLPDEGVRLVAPQII